MPCAQRQGQSAVNTSLNAAHLSAAAQLSWRTCSYIARAVRANAEHTWYKTRSLSSLPAMMFSDACTAEVVLSSWLRQLPRQCDPRLDEPKHACHFLLCGKHGQSPCSSAKALRGADASVFRTRALCNKSLQEAAGSVRHLSSTGASS